MELAPDSRAYQEWVTPSVPIYFDVYMFNWTNADKFPVEMPKLQEIGKFILNYLYLNSRVDPGDEAQGAMPQLATII